MIPIEPAASRGVSCGGGRCWGSNGSGVLGNNSVTNSSVPVVVSGLSNATVVSAGQAQTCAALADGTTTHSQTAVDVRLP